MWEDKFLLNSVVCESASRFIRFAVNIIYEWRPDQWNYWFSCKQFDRRNAFRLNVSFPFLRLLQNGKNELYIILYMLFIKNTF